MTVGIVGLGLIGGSFAKAYHDAGHRVLAANRSSGTLEFAMISGMVDEKLTKDNISRCDLVLIAVYPEAAISYLRENGPYIGAKPIVIDCCGTKRAVCDAGFPLAKEYGFTFIGGHPMAGNHHSGLKYATAAMYKGAQMVLVPPDFDDIGLLQRTKDLLAPAAFGHFSVTTADKHDEIIAFTSQMAHIVSNAYIKSPTAGMHKGFSAGSYKDLTRVAWLNPHMWAELFIENREHILFELGCFADNIQQYRDAIAERDMDRLIMLLDDGRKRKEEVDGH